MDLHGQIMNIRPAPIMLNPQPAMAYDQGHRDARHAAAEIVAGVDAELERLRGALAEIRDNESGPWCREVAREALAAPAPGELVSG